MNQGLIFLIVVIFIAITGVLVLNKNTATPSADIAIISPSPASDSVLAASQVPMTPVASSSPSVTPNISPTPISTDAAIAKTATIKTSKGDIEIQLYHEDAPKTVENFVKKAQSDYYKNLTFHRVEDWVIQGGDPLGNGTGGGSIPTELNKKPFGVGAVGVARAGDIKVSNDSQFFITKKDASWLNEQYTNFGQVTKGMDVVNKMEIGDKILSISVQ